MPRPETKIDDFNGDDDSVSQTIMSCPSLYDTNGRRTKNKRINNYHYVSSVTVDMETQTIGQEQFSNYPSTHVSNKSFIKTT